MRLCASLWHALFSDNAAAWTKLMISGRNQTMMVIQHEDFRLCLIRELNHARKITLLPYE